MRTETITVADRQYEAHKLTPFVGAHIYMRMMGALVASASEQKEEPQPREPQNPKVEETPREKARMLCLLAFMKMNLEDASYARQQALLVVRRCQPDAPAIPVMTSDGRFAFSEIEEDPAIMQQLVTESLAYSLESFLSKSTPSPALTK